MRRLLRIGNGYADSAACLDASKHQHVSWHMTIQTLQLAGSKHVEARLARLMQHNGLQALAGSYIQSWPYKIDNADCQAKHQKSLRATGRIC